MNSFAVRSMPATCGRFGSATAATGFSGFAVRAGRR
jgi:hypothetical protein